MFSSSIQEKLDRYVYRLVDPRTDNTFYVGKGIGNRMFQHDQAATNAGQSNGTIERIREIEADGKQVVHAVHRHGLTEEQALEVEAALIDAYGLENLTNVVPGIDSERGNMTVDEIKSLYEPETAEIDEPAILIKVNRLWYRGIPEDELYAITRGYWNCRPNNRRIKPRYALSINDGIVRQVYEIVGDWQ